MVFVSMEEGIISYLPSLIRVWLACCFLLAAGPMFFRRQFIQKKNRLAVYSYLFKEGVLVAKKDFFKPKHDKIEDVPNLEVLALMKSMKSRGLVRETFNW